MHPNDGRVVSNFIVQALKGEPITLYGTASSARLIISGHIQGIFVRISGLGGTVHACVFR